MRKLIVVLEDNADRVTAMQEWLADRLHMYESFFSETPARVIDAIVHNFDRVLAVSLDHDLLEIDDGSTDLTGMEVAQFLGRRDPAFPVLIHSSNALESDRMERLLRKSRWPVYRVHPFLDTTWVGQDWYPTLRRAIRKFAKPAGRDFDRTVDDAD